MTATDLPSKGQRPKFIPKLPSVGPAVFSVPTKPRRTRVIVPLPDRLGPTIMRIFCWVVSGSRQYPKNSCRASIACGSSGQISFRKVSQWTGSGAFSMKQYRNEFREKKSGVCGYSDSRPCEAAGKWIKPFWQAKTSCAGQGGSMGSATTQAGALIQAGGERAEGREHKLLRAWTTSATILFETFFALGGGLPSSEGTNLVDLISSATRSKSSFM